MDEREKQTIKEKKDIRVSSHFARLKKLYDNLLHITPKASDLLTVRSLDVFHGFL
jgi:hypothetical protein